MDLKPVISKELALRPAYEFIKHTSESEYIKRIIIKRLSPLILILGLILYLLSWIAWFIPYILVLMIISFLFYFFIDTGSYYSTNLFELTQYKDQKLLNKCWEKASKWNKDIDVFSQICVGYCAYASINSVLSVIFQQKIFLQYPRKPSGISLNAMYNTLNKCIDNILIKEKAQNIGISIQKIELRDDICLQQFINMIKELDNSNIFYIANFNRSPLFHCNRWILHRFWWWLRGGHFSPIIGYIHDDNNKMFVLIADVNQQYGNYLVPVDRLYQAVRAKNQIGARRGLIRFELAQQ